MREQVELIDNKQDSTWNIQYKQPARLFLSPRLYFDMYLKKIILCKTAFPPSYHHPPSFIPHTNTQAVLWHFLYFFKIGCRASQGNSSSENEIMLIFYSYLPIIAALNILCNCLCVQMQRGPLKCVASGLIHESFIRHLCRFPWSLLKKRWGGGEIHIFIVKCVPRLFSPSL